MPESAFGRIQNWTVIVPEKRIEKSSVENGGMYADAGAEYIFSKENFCRISVQYCIY